MLERQSPEQPSGAKDGASGSGVWRVTRRTSPPSARPASPKKTDWSNQLTQQFVELPATDENASVETPRCHLRGAAHSTALTVLGRARRQHQDWFDNDAVIIKLLAESRLHEAHLDRPPNANRATFYQLCRPAQQR
ncbi:hypothetical protein SprV_0301028000 [Sparganum proliferum]